MVRRFVTLTLSFCLVLGVGIMQVHSSFAQGEAKKEAQPPKSDPAKKDTVKEAPKTDTTKTDTPKAAAEATKAAEPPLPPIPPEVQDKLVAARKAVAEAIVAAQDAGLVETSIDPPPILDILITGRADDAAKLKGKTDANPEVGVSPEVFGAWFTGYNKPGLTYVPQNDVRIINPSSGLKAMYDQLGIDDLDKLKEACEAGRVAELKGFGAKTQQNILNGLQFVADLQTMQGRRGPPDR